MGHHHDRRGRDQPNGRKILIHVIAGMNGQAYAGEHHHQRVAVGRGLGGGARTDNGARARAVLDDDLLAKGRREFLRNHSAHRVRTAAGRVWHDQRNRTRRIGLRPGDPRDGRQRGGAGGQMQEFAAGKFHFTSTSPFTSFNHLVGARKKRRRHFEAERLCGRNVYDEIEFGRLLDREVARFRPPQNSDMVVTIRQVCRAPAGPSRVLVFAITIASLSPAISWWRWVRAGFTSRPATCSSVSKCSRVRTPIAMYASGAVANTAQSARSSYRTCSGRSPASVGRTNTSYKIGMPAD